MCIVVRYLYVQLIFFIFCNLWYGLGKSMEEKNFKNKRKDSQKKKYVDPNRLKDQSDN